MGSYGISYLVFDTELNKQVVLKMLRLHKRKTVKGQKMFQQEAEILKKLQSRHIPTLYDIGEVDHIPFFTMEYCTGKTFERLIFQEGKKYNEVESLYITLKLLEIVDYIHEHNIIHRDLRIPNIISANNNALFVIDFGLARYEEKGNEKEFDHRNPTRNSDFYYVGHFLLFLLYSSFEQTHLKERSWEEELTIHHETKRIIRKLLTIDQPYERTSDIGQEIQKTLNIIGGS